ncbi:hypothetical protein D6D21_01226 [Aureobasidium pullulans]|uniref:Ribosomal protein L9 domain-containing protein n=1 Tax=Aureobasidium pullulans TaxID=5580 RepID=A0A4S9BI76_AURPU|nr:hypothetical protein D6D21_01226 [Aureobasidium pullulans]THW93050.1 hypothetical protein D6D15_02724 [Aureobasidium pullulans]
MSFTMRPTVLPQCTSCLRRISNIGLQEWRSGQQVRGKKKLANTPTTVTVRLTKDVPTFGRKGTYVPISIGRMRNEFFPTRTAEYVSSAQLKDMKAKNISAERDFQFGVPDPTLATAAEIQPQRLSKRTVEVEKLAASLPKRSTELLAMLLPPVMEFRRRAHAPTVPTTPETPAPVKRERPFSSAAADLLAAQTAAPSKASSSSATSIYGAIYPADVVSRITHILSENQEASRIVLGTDDVKFVNLLSQEAADADKIRHLGDFKIEVRVKGGEVPVERLVRVLPTEGEDATVSSSS